MGKVEIKKKQKQESIFETAFELFTSKGLYNTSIADIAEKAGVAKGTFYLYFRDKYDLQNKLVADRAGKLFMKAYHALDLKKTPVFEDQLVFMVDHILEQLRSNKRLLTFISKNLSWGVFLGSLEKTAERSDSEFLSVYRRVVELSNKKYRDPELLLYMIIELVSSCCYSVILYEEPVSLDELKPSLYQTIRDMLARNEID